MKIKNILTALVFLMSAMAVNAQKKNFSYKFYGQVRTDFFYNSRANNELVDGLLQLFPLDKKPDANGEDLNAVSNSSFYILYSRLGVDFSGPNIGKASTFGKLEADFRGTGSNFTNFRIRHAYLGMKWDKSKILLGQTWHPMCEELMPQVLNLSTGAPFQPLSRTPQIRYNYITNGWNLIGTLLWQSQFSSVGINNVRSTNYQKNSGIPEIYAGFNYRNNHWMFGAGVDMLSIKPRTESVMNATENGVTVEKIYKVDERITSLSYEAYLRYASSKWFIAAKSMIANNLTQTMMLGGFGVTEKDAVTGKQKYTPITYSTTWFNATYGTKWKPGVFIGYSKNLGSSKAILDEYGTGLNIDQLFYANADISYNLPNWKFGVSYSASTAWYGDVNKSNAKVQNTHTVTNHRIVGMVAFSF